MPEKTCKLHVFTWAYVNPNPPGKPQLSPICTLHPESNKIFRTEFGNDITVLCKELGTDHLVGTCQSADFKAEEQQARDLLRR